MPIQLEAHINLPRPPTEVFAFLDDLKNTPKWNDRCVEVTRLYEASQGVGTRLRYVYKEGSRQGEMEGSIIRWEVGTELMMKFSDAMMDVVVGFRLGQMRSGTTLHHTIEIKPKSFMTRVMSPFIKAATRKQLQREVAALSRLLA